MNEIESRHNIRLNEEIIKKLNKDTKFEKLVNKIENVLVNFSKENSLNFSLVFNIKSDWEVPTEKVFILQIDFKGLNFKKELRYWKEINDLVYQEIDRLLTRNKTNAEYYKEFKEKFFIQLAL